jgi:hypothetical protein
VETVITTKATDSVAMVFEYVTAPVALALDFSTFPV